jgi:serine acetyltransferase
VVVGSSQVCPAEQVRLGEDGFIAPGAALFVDPHREIIFGARDHAIIGMGSVVTRSVPAWAIVAGSPARVIGDRREQP